MVLDWFFFDKMSNRFADFAYLGRVVEDSAADPKMAAGPLILGVSDCVGGQINIPFHVGDDHSRTWILTMTENGLQFQHKHCHMDGTEDRISRYGGLTSLRDGSRTAQQFPADAFTQQLLPIAATNVWTLMFIRHERAFQYSFHRKGRTFIAEFDLATPYEGIVPPAWGG